MKKISTFNDYMVNMLLEATEQAAITDDLRLVISNALRKYLINIDHPIARDIVEKSNASNDEYKITYIDIDDSDPNKKDMVSFMSSYKAIDSLMKDKNIKKDGVLSDMELKTIKGQVYNTPDKFFLEQKNRPKTKIGRIIAKLFPGKYKQSGDPGKDIESFVNKFKAARDTSNFEIVQGDDIQYWYNENQYVGGGGPLNNSCMKYDSCKKYLQLYADNPEKVSLVILKDSENNEKIKGRAILWNLDIPSGRTFMDRIYTVNDSDVILFQDYARENGWIHKKYQNMSEDDPFIDTKTGKDLNLDLVVNGLEDPGSGGYPYMDTMKFFDGYSISNSTTGVGNDDIKKLEDTGGGYDESGTYSEFYGDYIDEDNMIYCDRYTGDDAYRYEDDCYYSDFYIKTIANDYAEAEMEELDHYDDYYDRYRDYGDYITTYEGNTCDEDYAMNNFAWSEYEREWLENWEDSDYHDGPIPSDNATEVYTDVVGYDTDWRINDSDGHWWEWEYDGEKYDDDITEEELREHHDLDEEDDEDEEED
jgi:hypothetical protein